MKKTIKVKGYSVYSELGESIVKEFTMDLGDAWELHEQAARKGQMPRESYTDALARYHIVNCTITYELPTP